MCRFSGIEMEVKFDIGIVDPLLKPIVSKLYSTLHAHFQYNYASLI